MRTATVDNHLAALLGRMMSADQNGFDTRLPALFVFSARSIEQRFEIVRKMFLLRCEPAFAMPRNSNVRRAAEFAEKVMNVVFANVGAHRWIRNVAAHGTMIHTDAMTAIIPAMFDHEGQKKFFERGKAYKDGLTLELLKEASETAMFDLLCLSKLGNVLWTLFEMRDDPKEFVEQANGLAQDLKLSKINLRDPREGPPPRRRKQNPPTP